MCIRKIKGWTILRAKLYLESGSTEHGSSKCLAWILVLPGCVAYGETPEQAFARAPEKVWRYLDWLRIHGENVPAGIELEPKPSEIFHVSRLGDYEINATFVPDFGAPFEDEVERCLRWMRYSREDLLTLVRETAEMLDVKPDPSKRSVREILQHIGTAEIWYISRLESDPKHLSWPELPKETLPLLETTRAWAIQRLRSLPLDFGKQIFTHEGEVWTLKKVLRRFLYHETYHRQQIAHRLGTA
jgi:predicted RNase H-like HicB family nuclease/uncharacterized damage-inducible protein DinB